MMMTRGLSSPQRKQILGYCSGSYPTIMMTNLNDSFLQRIILARHFFEGIGSPLTTRLQRFQGGKSIIAL
jgi:hypothetical protein